VRIALLSLIIPADDDPRTPLGLLQLAGKTVAARQLDLALQLGCERVICVAAALDRPVLALQHQAEAMGVKFNLISGPRPLLGLIGAEDELIGFADGLLPSPEEAEKALAGGKGVLVLPVEAGTAAGFERIDLNHAWAGMFAMPGRLVERLSELPPDCDAISALLRIALQGKVPEKILPEAVLAEGRWTLVESRAQLVELEPDWFRRHAARPSPWAPGRALARLAMGRAAGMLLSRGVKSSLFTTFGIGIAAIGVAGAWLGQAVPAIVACGIGWLLVECGAALRDIAAAGSSGTERPNRLATAADWLIDLYLVAVLVPVLPGHPLEGIVGPALLLGLLRLGERLLTPKWAEFLQDRAVLSAILALAAAYGVLMPALEGLSVLALGALLGFAGRETRLTQV
jgi:hypothetical protein